MPPFGHFAAERLEQSERRAALLSPKQHTLQDALLLSKRSTSSSRSSIEGVPPSPAINAVARSCWRGVGPLGMAGDGVGPLGGDGWTGRRAAGDHASMDHARITGSRG